MPISRREWILASVCWSELLAARTAQGPVSFTVLSAAEAKEIEALSSAILPETDTPGAAQAGAVSFIDAALAGYDHDQLGLYRQGLLDIAAQTRQMFPPTTAFSKLSEVQQMALLKSMDKTEFFEKLRIHTVLAYFGNPQFGWKLMGRDAAPHFEPPFGSYDSEIKTL